MRTAGRYSSLAALVAFVLRSRRRHQPGDRCTDLHGAGVRRRQAVSFAAPFSQFSRVNITALELQIVRGLDAQAVGVLISPAQPAALMSPVGAAPDRFGSLPGVRRRILDGGRHVVAVTSRRGERESRGRPAPWCTAWAPVCSCCRWRRRDGRPAVVVGTAGERRSEISIGNRRAIGSLTAVIADLGAHTHRAAGRRDPRRTTRRSRSGSPSVPR